MLNKTHHPQLQQIVPLIEADPVPDMPTIEIRNQEDFKQTEKSDQNLCNIEQVLLQAIFNENMEQLKILKVHLRDLNFLEEFNDDFIDQQITPLALATATGSQDIVKLILTNEAIDINMETKPLGLTALKIACTNGFFEIAELLVQQGSNVNQKNSLGSVPLFYCFSRLEEDQNYFENKYLCFKLADLLIENGADIDAIVCQDKGYSLLMMFCSVKEEVIKSHIKIKKLTQQDLQLNLDVIEFLLSNGADRDKASVKGKNCKQLALKHPAKIQVLRMLDSIKPKYEIAKNRTKKNNQRPQLINQHQVIKLEGKQPSQNQCCSILSQTRAPQQRKSWWDIFS